MTRACRALVAVSVLAAVVAAGCDTGRGGAAPRVTVAPTTLGPAPTVRVGLLGSITTGPSLARAVEQGARLAVSQYSPASSAGGVAVSVVTGDTHGTEAGAARAARRLVADHVVAVIGPQTTAEVLGAEPVLARAGIPTLTVTATATSLTGRWSDLLSVVPDDRAQGDAVGSLVAGTLEDRQVAVVSDRGATAPTAAAAATAIRAAGATVEAMSVTGASDAASVAERVVAGGADGVIVAARPAVAVAVVVALVAAGFAGSTVVLAGTYAPSGLLRAAGDDADGVRIVCAADDTAGAASDTTSSALVLRDAYRAAYGRVPPTWAAEAYDAAEFVLAGLGAGDTSPSALAAYLTSHQWVGVTGTLGFTGGQPTDPRMYVSIVRDGAVVQAGTVG